MSLQRRRIAMRLAAVGAIALLEWATGCGGKLVSEQAGFNDNPGHVDPGGAGDQGSGGSPSASGGSSGSSGSATAAQSRTLTTLASGYRTANAIAVDSRNVYWTTDSSVMKVPIAGGTPTILGGGNGAIAVDATSMY